MNNICRLCLKKCCKPFYEIEVDCALIKQIFLCFSYQLAIAEHISKKICNHCINKLKEIKSFRQMVIDNEKILLNRITLLKQNEDLKDSIPIKEENEWGNVEQSDEASENNSVNIKLENTDFCDVTIHDEGNCGSKVPDSMKSLKEEHVSVIEDIQSTNSDIIKSSDSTVQTSCSEVAPYTCLMCFKKFQTKMKLLQHYITDENSKYVELTSKIDVNMTHTKLINDNTVYVCKECEKEFRTQKLMVNHLLSHNDEWPFSCKLCGRMYITASDIVKHGKSHSHKNFICSFKCGFSSGYAHIVKNHESRHRKKFKYTCQECGKSFQVKTWYEQHQNVHKGVRQYVCSICGASFHMDRYLTAHKNSVHPEATSHKRYICVHCSRICNSKHGLNLHLKEHGVKKEYLCDICGKVMKNPEQLKLHRRIHGNERPYVCGTCNRSFAKNYNLKLHQAVHAQDRLRCTICTKTFTQRSSLNRHTSRKHAMEVNQQK